MKKLFALILTVAMLATMSVTVFAEEVTYNLYVAGVQVTSENLEIDHDDNELITSGSATYNPVEGILTLDNFTFSGDCGKAVISADGLALTIKLVGQNVIENSCEFEPAISIDRDLIESEWTTIIDGDETNQGADLIVISDNTDGILANSLIIDGCNIEVESLGMYAYGIGVYCDMIIKDSVINSNAYFCGLLADETIEILNSEVTVNSQNNAGVVVDMFGRVDGSGMTITNSTVNAHGGFEGLYLPCANFEVVNSVVIATSDKDGIYFYETDVKLNDAEVYLGDEAPGQRMSDPAISDFQCKYVKIISMSAPRNESTVVTYSVAPTFTVTIPATVALGEDAAISADNVVVPKGKQVEVSISDANGFKATTPEGAELIYTVKRGEAAVAEGDTVLEVNPTDGKTGSTTLSFVAPETIQYAGIYTGTVTFTVAVKDEPKPLISFTIDGTSYQAEEGMTWAEWVADPAYNTVGLEKDGDWYIVDPSTDKAVFKAEWETCNPSDVIVADYEYYLDWIME